MSTLDKLRILMKDLDLYAFIIGSNDAHQSEYVPECDKRMSFVSGFTGSYGTAIICENKALQWTDPRYHLQASKELSAEWTLMREFTSDVPNTTDWLFSSLKKGQKVGVDPWLITAGRAKTLQRKLDSVGIQLIPIDSNLVDKVWEGRPVARRDPVKIQPMCYAGESHTDKIKKVQDAIKKSGATAIIISALDEIAWLLNIRGSDIPYNPVVVSYVVVTLDVTHLFIDTDKIDDTVTTHLTQGDKEVGVIVHPYEHIESFIVAQRQLGRIMADPAQVSWRLYEAAGAEKEVIEHTSPISLAKAVKNDIELKGFRDCHIRDGAALTAFLCWLESAVTGTGGGGGGGEGAGEETNTPVTEWSATQKLEEFRKKDPMHVSPSFATIAGCGPNGAIIHYRPKENGCAVIGPDDLLLLDSGAQYLDGTTDVTRTIHFGTPTDYMKKCFTAVLKGHIAIATVVFPEGTKGSVFESRARAALWCLGLDYGHGTGHGVGSYLNVHEGPQAILSRTFENEAGFQPGMTISNEPGYYEDGAFGIRIESLCVTVEKPTPNNFQGKRFCGFETVQLAPIQRKMIIVEMLTDVELSWLNEYHKKVRDTLLPMVKERFPEAVQYLINGTEFISRN